MTTDDLSKLEGRLARAKSTDRRARLTDAARHLREAIVILEGCAETTPTTHRVASLLVEAADLLGEATP